MGKHLFQTFILQYILRSFLSKPKDIDLSFTILTRNKNKIFDLKVRRCIFGKKGNIVIIDYYLGGQDEIPRLVAHLSEEEQKPAFSIENLHHTVPAINTVDAALAVYRHSPWSGKLGKAISNAATEYFERFPLLCQFLDTKPSGL